MAAQVTPRDTTKPPVVRAPIPLPPDSQATLDTATARQRRDSVHADSLKADTLRAPFARAESPRLPETNGGWRWERDEILSSGALTLGELLERVPGAVRFRPSWIHSPEAVSFAGDPGAIRVFLDGVELDELDPRNGLVKELEGIPLWALEEVRVERGARELRVHLHSWRYDRTIPFTRFDVGTGDETTNLYRGFFGKRYHNGAGLQVGLQQYSTADPRTGLQGANAGGRSLSLMIRTGWARGKLSFDATAMQDGRTRNPEIAYTTRTLNGSQFLGAPVADSIPGLRGTTNAAYLRGAYGDPESGPWLQAIASSLGFRESTGQSKERLGRPLTHADTLRGFAIADTTPSRAEYVVAGGLSRWGARLSATARARVFDGRTITSPVARASFDTRFGAVAARAEQNGFNHATSVEAGLSALPLPWISIAAVAERTQGANDGTPSGNSGRAEVGVRHHDAWISVGGLYRDSTLAAVPWVYYSDFSPDSARHPPLRVAVSGARGAFVTVRGKLFRDAGLDATVTRWTSPDFFRPQYEARSEIFLRTRWLSRFPKGEFALNATLIHEYRSSTRFPTYGPAGQMGLTDATGSQALSSLIELHIRSAYITWQYRNFLGVNYALVPGYLMPHKTNFYGVRWEFFN
ncbi:MAG: Plug domain-containing protein [Gemmatimonadaceae bacterium]|nr:Plug domain-containing protein [Gemmatimonadaceae bacterium]NUQ93434.1 Plug domain-containing protein [Gemmatimonadaceae bacterium]